MTSEFIKKTTLFTALTLLCTSSFLQAQDLHVPIIFHVSNNHQDMFQKDIDHEELRQILETKSSRQLRKYVERFYGKSVTEKYLTKLALEYQNTKLQRAISASRALHKLSGTGLSKKEILLLSLFIENELGEFIAKKQYYLSAKKLHIPRTVEHDPETKLTFIHLGTNKVQEIGRGYQKIVTKSILYDIQNPEIVANCETSSNISREVNLMKEVKNFPGLVETRAFTKHKKNNTTYMSIICKLYNEGSLQQVMDKEIKFSFKEKVGMALNIMKGLHYLHKNKIIHRDLGAKNYFVNIDKNKNKRNVTCVIADLGRSYHYKGIKKDSSPQGNKYYYSSEMFFPEKMSPKDYTYSDLYATGCVLYRLLYEKKTPWPDVLTNRNESISRKDRAKKALHRLKESTNPRRQQLKAKGSKLSSREIFEKVIYQMIHPDPKARGTALEHAKTLHRLYKKQ